MKKSNKKRHLKTFLYIIGLTFALYLLISNLSEKSDRSIENEIGINGAVYLDYSSKTDYLNLSSIDKYIHLSSPILNFSRKYTWEYKNISYNLTFTLYPELFSLFKERDRNRDYDLFASDNYSQSFIKQISGELYNLSNSSGLTREELPNFIASFVQSLRYTSDKVTTGYDEYPRFPYETFYEDGGDCEDTSIFASSILNELGYRVALIQFPGHIAIGVLCNSSLMRGYINFENISYCYIETTGKGWTEGVVPPKLNLSQAKVLPIIGHPQLVFSFNSKSKYDFIRTIVDVNVNIVNIGSNIARNVTLHVSLQSQNLTKEWDKIDSKHFDIPPESKVDYNVTHLFMKTGSPFRIYVRINSSDQLAIEGYSNWIYWDWQKVKYIEYLQNSDNSLIIQN